jgi:hypothetical protein
MAARVAAKLRAEQDVEVETIEGGLGEFTVLIDGREAVKSSRLWYPNPSSVIRRVKQQLRET